jgi:hypothetical protein
MYHTPETQCEELIEGRVLQTLAQHEVLSYGALKSRAAPGADDRTVRRVLRALIAAGQVRQQPAHNCVWYLGFARATAATHGAGFDDLPAPFARLLRELAGQG